MERSWNDSGSALEIVLELDWNCSGTFGGSYRGGKGVLYAGTVLELHLSCTGSVLDLSWICSGIVVEVYWHCSGVALGL